MITNQSLWLIRNLVGDLYFNGDHGKSMKKKGRSPYLKHEEVLKLPRQLIIVENAATKQRRTQMDN